MNAWHSRSWALLLAIALCCVVGCDEDENIPSNYGQQSGPQGAGSVNGIGVLATMVEQAGNSVTAAAQLSPQVEQGADVIVWAPDDFAPPTSTVQNRLDKWLNAKRGRVLIYIGRDYDAEVTYWHKIRPLAPANQLPEVDRRIAAAEQRFDQERDANLKNDTTCPWFDIDASPQRRSVRKLAGPWSTGIDPTKADIELGAHLDPPSNAEILLESDGDALISRQWYNGYSSGFGRMGGNPGDSQLIVVANGSFLLNLPLVNREHRKLAAKLLAEIPAKSRVLFIESGPGGPAVTSDEEPPEAETPYAVLTFWPLNWIFLHLGALGLVYVFFCWPIFGIPRDRPADSTSDFAKHVNALGGLMRATRDRAFALTRLNYYQQHVRTDVGMARAKPPTPKQEGI